MKRKVAIVTGGSRGIGLAVSGSLAREGAAVVIASKNRERGITARDSLTDRGLTANFVPTDVSDRKQVERLVAEVIKLHGTIDVLVNNAGIHEKALFCDESKELWLRLYRTNVLGTAMPSQAVARHMMKKKKGAIVHIASKASVVGEPGHVAYSASKGAVISMTRSMAVELAPYGIRVNAVCPGPVETDMYFTDLPTPELQKAEVGEAPLKSAGKPQDIAEIVLYLASAESDWCTGQAISVDGGMSILK
jgi:3-oxoacyl-[acyl-carrier protein] reductase